MRYVIGITRLFIRFYLIVVRFDDVAAIVKRGRD